MPETLRVLSEPFVAPAPAGVRIRTRLRPTAVEAAALTAFGAHLGALYRADLAQRVRAGRLSGKGRAESRRVRKQALTGVSSSRWAGTLTRAVEDQYQLAMRALVDEVRSLRAAATAIEARLEVPAGLRERRVRGYRDTSECHAKARRLTALRDRLATAEARMAGGRPKIVAGGGRLWRNRHHLAETGMTEAQWRQQWDAAR